VTGEIDSCTLASRVFERESFRGLFVYQKKKDKALLVLVDILENSWNTAYNWILEWYPLIKSNGVEFLDKGLVDT